MHKPILRPRRRFDATRPVALAPPRTQDGCIFPCPPSCSSVQTCRTAWRTRLYTRARMHGDMVSRALAVAITDH